MVLGQKMIGISKDSTQILHILGKIGTKFATQPLYDPDVHPITASGSPLGKVPG